LFTLSIESMSPSHFSTLKPAKLIHPLPSPSAESIFQMMESVEQARAALYERDDFLAQRHRRERTASIAFPPSPPMIPGPVSGEGNGLVAEEAQPRHTVRVNYEV
jgi:hypothetical protein